ncbi:MAG: MBL fold metallo-hydrolase [Gammaproteobacteria bacterium]|nr:MAG: MBL fold metallo-hydrolase [Gammaproteobacteria bacterium]
MRMLALRVRILCWVALLAALAPLATPTQAQFIPGLAPNETEDLGNGLYAFRHGGYRNIFLVTDEGVIATDPLGPKEAEVLRQEIAKVTDKPVKFVAYSHSHWDHVSGGKIFKDEGARFVAQEKCAENISETPHPDVIPPDVTFADNYKIELGGRSLELYYFGPSHDDCMVVMVARPANILFVIDIGSAPTGWFMEYNPTMSDTHLYNMVPYLRAVEALMEREGIETIVSGHLSITIGDDGQFKPLASTGPAVAIREKREFWEMLYGFVRQEMAAGASVDDVPAKVIANPEFQDEFVEHIRRGYEEEEMWILVRRVATYIASGR